MSLNVNISEVISGSAEQQVVINAAGTEFGVFDGYKDGKDGTERFAVAKWMEGIEVKQCLAHSSLKALSTPPWTNQGSYRILISRQTSSTIRSEEL